MIIFDKNNPDEVPEIPTEIAACPICQSPLIIEDIDEWETETSRVTESGLHINCITQPDIDGPEWDQWFDEHWSTPYVDWLPVYMIVYRWFDSMFRIKI